MIDTKRIRRAARMAPGLASTSELMVAAADEIDRLRASLCEIKTAATDTRGCKAQRIYRIANQAYQGGDDLSQL